ncbi:hypothetical protein C8Q80DRAFT_1164258 [Daedaleopsis nitida]|nr:hypothetical protein C8Q80DRAFT_1164258 [Daedaleopsis nitida]
MRYVLLWVIAGEEGIPEHTSMPHTQRRGGYGLALARGSMCQYSGVVDKAGLPHGSMFGCELHGGPKARYVFLHLLHPNHDVLDLEGAHRIISHPTPYARTAFLFLAMLHNQSLLGFSLLVLSCTSPTLGAIVDSSPSLDSVSPPPSPLLGTNKDVSFKASNPPSAQPVLESVPLSESAQVAPATISTNSAAASTGVSTGINPSLAILPLKMVTHASSHNSGAHRAKHHSSLAAHFSTQQLKLQSHTLGNSATATPSSSTTPAIRPAVAAHVQDEASVVSSGLATQGSALMITSSASLSLATAISTAIVSFPTSSLTFSSLASVPPLGSFDSTTVYSTPHLTTSQAMAAPTAHDLSDPNPDDHASSSEASQTARKTAYLAAILILGGLGALGGGVVCFRCGLLPCCHGKSRRQRGPTLTERTVEEGLRSLQKLAPITTNEKVGSLIPGRPPVAASNPFHLPILPRNMHAHTLSCSTCPPDSLNGVKGGISGTDPNGFRVYATNDEGEFEDVTHILTPDAVSDKRASTNSSLGVSASPRHSVRSTKSANTCTSTSGRSDMVRFSTTTVESATTSTRLSVHTRASRASEGATSMTAESYTTCESRYSTPSMANERDRPPSAFGRIRFADSSEDDEFHSPAETSSSTTSGGSMSLLLMTPESDYAGLADAALFEGAGESAGAGAADAETKMSSASSGTVDMELEESEWDVAGAYAYGGPPAMPLPKVPGPMGKNAGAVSAIRDAYAAGSNASGNGNGNGAGRGRSVKGRPQTGVGLRSTNMNANAVALGGRTCVLMRG